MIQQDKKMQIIVFVVNMLSPNKSHVSSGKTKYEAANPMNRADHASPVSSKI
tara:strand:- start:513 stop:668 length:156 start_codon:yes stop_codon:yes gene_type:complete